MKPAYALTVLLFAAATLIGERSVPFLHAEDSSAEAAEGVRRFDREIAPLLRRHCLECHNGQTKKGRLDLSTAASALAGGDSGPALLPGSAEESLLWTYVESDEMPQDRPPLSDEEKRLLRDWIDDGAVWSERPLTRPGLGDDEPIARHQEFDCAGGVRDPGPAILRRLTVPEYIETVRSSLGIDIERDARRLLPRDLRADGFSNTAYNLNVDLEHVQAYAELARIIVSRLDVAAFAAEHSGARLAAEFDEQNMREVIAGIGKWLLRGPLPDREVGAYLDIAQAVSDDGGDAAEALGYVIEAMLQSPRFIYRMEDYSGDGTPRRVGDYELASRLSYILWGAPPDKELMRAADAGELSDRENVAAQVRRMLRDARTIERSEQFVSEWLDLARLENLRPSPERFPHWDELLAADMRAETLAFFKDVAWEQNRPLADLMNAQVTFATPRLARHYGLEQTPSTPVAQDSQVAAANVSASRSVLALYRFDEGGGDMVRDVSGTGEPIDLRIGDASAVHWSSDGLTVASPTLITSDRPPARLIDAVRSSGEVTVEAWVTPENASQEGPARIVSLSAGPNARNFTLGQDGDRYDFRLRTTETSTNGIPSVSTPRRLVETRPTHIVYTRDTTGRAKLYVDGEQTIAGNINGDMSNWDGGFHLALANETSGDRPWRGTFHLVAIYDRALSAEEIRSQGSGLARYDLTPVPSRGGLLTQGSVLTVGGDEASMVTRGLFVLHDVLSSGVDDPPPCVDTTPVPTEPGMSQRTIVEARIADAACGGCHARFEPLAFGLEKFDGIGGYHERDEHGNELRDDGEILFPNRDEPVAYATSAELMDLLANSERVSQNMTLKLTQFALGRPLVESDVCLLEEIHQAAQENGGTYTALITAIVMSDLVHKTRTVAD